ncbi:MAG: hypothetical protein AAGG09_23370 [Pseudomonadota bacterium]
MTKMTAVLMHGERGGEGTYTFDLDGDPGELRKSTIVRTFMTHLDAHYDLGGPLDYEVDAVFRDDARKILTVIGKLIFEGENVQPFACFISPAA